METAPNQSPSSSPNSNGNGDGAVANSLLLPPTPSPIAHPYPTTFIQADAQSFKQVVQMLTGSADATAAKRAQPHNAKSPIPPLNRTKKPAFKLYERRPSMKSLNMTVGTSAANPSNPPTVNSPLSPSVLDFPSLALISPVTPLLAATEDREEEGFYLQPSPRSTAKPKLLPLFPVTSPRDSR